MKIILISIGAKRDRTLRDIEAEYLKRLSSWSVSTRDIPGSSKPGAAALDEEGRELLKLLEPGDFLVALDERGQSRSSEQLARMVDDRMQRGTKRLLFVVGSAFGLSAAVRERADVVLALSAFTLPHEFARLVMIEQIYRSYTLLTGRPYHK